LATSIKAKTIFRVISFLLALFANEGLFKMVVPLPDTKAIEGVSSFICVPLSANVLKLHK
jgi:hypothetical protein